MSKKERIESLEMQVDSLKEELKDLKKNQFVVCQVTKSLIRKEDAYVVTIGFPFLSEVEEYYSPKFAPDYDYVDMTGDTPKYFKTVKEQKVEVGIKKRGRPLSSKNKK